MSWAHRAHIEELPLWALSAGASSWIADLRPYEGARVAGFVEKMRIEPAEGCVRVSIWDGTGEMGARWHIRRPTPQLAVVPGRFVLLNGVPVAGEHGFEMVEPSFEVAVHHEVA
jgi:hypothetical protein